MSSIDLFPKILFSLIGLLLVAAAILLLAGWLGRRLRVQRDREHRLKLHHRANFRAVYYLAVESAEPSLRFQFLVGKTPLVDISRPAPVVETKIAGKKTTPAAKTHQAVAASAAQPAAMGKALDAGKQVSQKAGALSSLMGILASILPKGMASKLKEQQEGVKKVQVDSARAAQAPKEAQQRLEAVQNESKKLGVKVGNGPSPAPAPAASMAAPETLPATIEADSPSIEQTLHPFEGLYCVQTVEIEPGQSLPVTLRIGANSRRYPSGSFAYTVRLQAAPVASLSEKLPLVSKGGVVSFAPVALWRYWMPGVSGLLLVLLGLLSSLYLALLIWQ